MTDDPSTIRVLAVARTSDLAHAVVGSLADARVAAAAAWDRTSLREGLSLDTLVAVLVHEGVGASAAEAVARAARETRDSPVAVALLTDEVRPHDANGHFDVTVKYPVAGRVLAARIEKVLRSHAAPAAVDDRMIRAEIELRGDPEGTRSHYEVLGVRPGASADAVTAAYDRLSLLLHPDRLRTLQDAELLDRAAALYDRVGEAFRVLRRPNARTRYDQALARGSAGDVGRISDRAMQLTDLSDSANTRKYLQLAQAALHARDRRMALVHLRFAATLEPDNEALASHIARLDELEASDSEE